MPTKEEMVAKAEAAFKDRVFAKLLRSLPKPTYRCGKQPQHKAGGFAIVEWQTDGTAADDAWWCDNCTLGMHNDSDLVNTGAHGEAKCAKCNSPLVEAAQRRPVVVKVQPCIRCGLIFWDKMVG